MEDKASEVSDPDSVGTDWAQFFNAIGYTGVVFVLIFWFSKAFFALLGP